MSKRMFKNFISTFIKGIIVLSPLLLTGYILFWTFYALDTLIFKDLYPGFGLLFIIGFITFAGYLSTRFMVGRWVVKSMDKLLSRTPGVKLLYNAIKDILNSFVGDDKKFEEAVWVNVDKTTDVWRIGFITQTQIKDMEHMVAVYLPHAYAISGWVVIVPKTAIKKVTSMTAGEAMKFAVSGGVTGASSNSSVLV